MRTLVAIVLTFTQALFGQRLLYNQDLDKKGQEAAAAAKKIASAPVTATELENLKSIEKQQIETTLSAGYLTMRTQVQAFGTWVAVSRSVCKSLRILYAKDAVAVANINSRIVLDRNRFDSECQSTVIDTERTTHHNVTNSNKRVTLRATGHESVDAYVQTQTNMLRSAMLKARAGAAAKQTKLAEAAKKDAAKPDSTAKDVNAAMTAKHWIDSAVDQIGNIKEALEAVNQIKQLGNADAASNAIDKLEEGLKELGDLIGAAAKIWSSYQDVAVDPRSLIPSKDKLAAALLAADADYIKEMAAIRAANAYYLSDMRKRLGDCRDGLMASGLWYSKASVESALTSGSTGQITNALYFLHLATAGAAMNQTPKEVADLRASLAQRRLSIRRDAVYNGSYETALQAAGQRLSNYYASGITKSQIAQLLYYLSGMVSLPKLAF